MDFGNSHECYFSKLVVQRQSVESINAKYREASKWLVNLLNDTTLVDKTNELTQILKGYGLCLAGTRTSGIIYTRTYRYTQGLG